MGAVIDVCFIGGKGSHCKTVASIVFSINSAGNMGEKYNRRDTYTPPLHTVFFKKLISDR